MITIPTIRQNRSLPVLKQIEENTRIGNKIAATSSISLEILNKNVGTFLAKPLEALVKIFNPEFIDKILAPQKMDSDFIGPVRPNDRNNTSFIGPHLPEKSFYEDLLNSFENIEERIDNSLKIDPAEVQRRARDDQETRRENENKRRNPRNPGNPGDPANPIVDAGSRLNFSKFFETLFTPKSAFFDKLSNGLFTGIFLGVLNPGLMARAAKAFMVAKAVPLLMTGLAMPVTAIISGIGYGIYDAVMNNDVIAGITNTGDIASSITRFIVGDQAKGSLMGMLGGAATWAGMGALAGAVGGPVGMLAGALIGAGLGAAFNYFGNSNLIADTIDKYVGRFDHITDLFTTDTEGEAEVKRAELASTIARLNEVVNEKMNDSGNLANEIASIEEQLREAVRTSNSSVISVLTEQLRVMRTSKEKIDADIEREREKLAENEGYLETFSLEGSGQRISNAIGNFAKSSFDRLVEDLQAENALVMSDGTKFTLSTDTFKTAVNATMGYIQDEMLYDLNTAWADSDGGNRIRFTDGLNAVRSYIENEMLYDLNTAWADANGENRVTFTGLADQAWAGLYTFGQESINRLLSDLNTAGTDSEGNRVTFTGLASDVWNGLYSFGEQSISRFLSDINTAGVDSEGNRVTFTGLSSRISDAVTDFVVGKVNNITDGIFAFFGGVKSVGADGVEMVGNAANFTGDAIARVSQKISEFVDSIVQSITDVITAIKDSFFKALASLKDTIIQTVSFGFFGNSEPDGSGVTIGVPEIIPGTVTDEQISSYSGSGNAMQRLFGWGSGEAETTVDPDTMYEPIGTRALTLQSLAENEAKARREQSAAPIVVTQSPMNVSSVSNHSSSTQVNLRLGTKDTTYGTHSRIG